MSFTPSDRFNERWLQSPTAMKQAIYDELDDIMMLLKDESRLQDFRFKNLDLHSKLSHLQTAHLDTLKVMTQKMRQERADTLIPSLEQQLEHKISQKLTERLVGLDDELKVWIRQVVQEELAKEVVL